MANAQIKVTMKSDLSAAAKDLREQKRVQQELADALGLTRAEVKRLQRNINKKAAADRKATATTTKSAASQANYTRATTSSTVATNAQSAALSRMGIAANSAFGPIGILVGVVAALGMGAVTLANGMSETVDELNHAAESTGVSTRTYLAMSRAIREAGGEVNQLQQGLRSFIQKQDLAGKSAAEVDAALVGEIKRIEQIAAPAERAAERMRLFGTDSSKAIAALTSSSMADARAKTEGLATAMEGAGKASDEMDRSAAELQDSWTELSIIFGQAVAPAVVATKDALTGLNKAQAETIVRAEELKEAGTQMEFTWFAINNPISGVVQSTSLLNDAIFGASRLTREYNDILEEQRVRALEVAEATAQSAAEQAVLNDMIMAPQRQEGRAKEERSRKVSAAVETQTEVEKARQSIADRWRREAFAAQVEDEEQRRAQVEQGRLLQEQRLDESLALARERGAIYEDIVARRTQAEQDLKAAQQDAALSAVSSASQLIGATSKSAEAVAVARVLETIAYGGVATMRAFAELGPIAGIPAALSMAAATAAQVASIKSTPSRHMGSMAPDEGTLRVRNGERVTVDPATVDTPRQPQVSILTIDNQAFTAMQRRSGRQDTIFGDRRRRAQEV